MASSSLSSRRGTGATWTPQQNKEFEKAVAKFDKDTPERWQNIAKAVGGGKTVEDVKTHYDILLEDLRRIESGRVPVPNYRNRTATAGEEEEKKASEVSQVSLKSKPPRSTGFFKSAEICENSCMPSYHHHM